MNKHMVGEFTVLLLRSTTLMDKHMVGESLSSS